MDLCKNYYSYLYFAVVTFMTKIQNWWYNTQKISSKHYCQKYLDGKNYYHPKNLDGKNHYHPRILTTIQKVGSSRISFSLFLLIQFWILVRNGICWWVSTVNCSCRSSDQNKQNKVLSWWNDNTGLRVKNNCDRCFA